MGVIIDQSLGDVADVADVDFAGNSQPVRIDGKFVHYPTAVGLRFEKYDRWLPIKGGTYMNAHYGATWRSGYATVCKTVYTSSILVVASINMIDGLQRLLSGPQKIFAAISAGGLRVFRELNKRPEHYCHWWLYAAY